MSPTFLEELKTEVRLLKAEIERLKNNLPSPKKDTK